MRELEFVPSFLVERGISGKLLIGLSCESDQPFSVHIHSEGLERGDTDIYSQIELEPVDQERIVDVLTHDHIVKFGNIARLVC